MFWTINTWKKQTNKQTNKNNNMFYMQSGLSYLRYELRLFPLKLLICKTSHRPGHTLPNTRRYAVSFERQMLVKNVMVYPHVSRYFWIRNFSFAHSSPTRIRCNPHLSSCIRSKESKCWVRYEIRIFFHPVMSKDRVQFFTVNIQGVAVRSVMASFLQFADSKYPDTCGRA